MADKQHIDLLKIDMETGRHWLDPVERYRNTPRIQEIRKRHRDKYLARKQAKDFNPHHVPAGSPEGGQFASGEGGWAGEPLKGSHGDPALVSTALTTAKPRGKEREAIRQESFNYQRVDLDQVKKDPEMFAAQVNAFRNEDLFPYMRASDFNGDPEHDSRSIIDRIKSNLEVMWKDTSEDAKNLWRQWYVGAHNMISDRMKQYPGVGRAAMTGMYAALSPGTQWDINVHQGDRILETVFHHGDDGWDKGMADAAQGQLERAEEGLKKAKNKERVQANIDDTRQLFKEAQKAGSYNKQTDSLHRAAWIKLWNDAHDDTPVRNVGIDGKMGAPMKNKGLDDNGEKADMSGAFGTLGRIENALQSLNSNGNTKEISEALGDLHKVRSFYNNMLDPHSANHDVTIDTHAAGAAWLDPLPQKSDILGQMFGSKPVKGTSSARLGVQGTYPFYADAYREFAKDKGFEPREVQSIIWEHKIALFKGAPRAKKELIKEAWHRFHDNPGVTLEQTQRRVLQIAKAGYNAEARKRRTKDGFDYSADETPWDSFDGGELPDAQLDGDAAGGYFRRGVGRDAGGIADFDPGQPRRAPGEISKHGGEFAPGSGGGGGAGSPEQAQRSATAAAAGHPKLAGLPDKPIKVGDEYYVPGPYARAQQAAERYMRSAGLPYDPPKQYLKVDKERAGRIADAFDQMKHDPDDPKVKASYEALTRETLAQWRAIKDTGLKVEWIKPGQPDPYAVTPRLAAMDVINNNHWWGFPTDAGFGSGEEAEAARHNNPMLQMTNEVVDGRRLMVNDVFRIVHDYFGHFKEGVGFRADGEENAWRSHSAMYSDLARGAMTSETRGQNSWVNFGPYGESNRTASAAETHFAPQKIGLMPEWTWNEGREDH